MDNIPLDKELLRKWLKAGFLEKHVLFATTEGTPQGGIASPVLANRALDGLQRLLEQRFSNTCRRRAECKVHLVRYADDFIISTVTVFACFFPVKREEIADFQGLSGYPGYPTFPVAISASTL